MELKCHQSQRTSQYYIANNSRILYLTKLKNNKQRDGEGYGPGNCASITSKKKKKKLPQPNWNETCLLPQRLPLFPVLPFMCGYWLVVTSSVSPDNFITTTQWDEQVVKAFIFIMSSTSVVATIDLPRHI